MNNMHFVRPMATVGVGSACGAGGELAVSGPSASAIRRDSIMSDNFCHPSTLVVVVAWAQHIFFLCMFVCDVFGM